MEKEIEDILSINCYLPRPYVSKVVEKILGRKATKEEQVEVFDFIGSKTFLGCSFFFVGCKEKNDCVWRKFL